MLYSFANKKRDLTDILTTIIRDEPRFISNFNRIVRCYEPVHSWKDDILTPAYVKYHSRSSSIFALYPEEAAKLRVGDTLVPVGGSSVFIVVEVGRETAHISLLGPNGSGTTVYDLPDNGGIFRIMPGVDREQATNEEEEEVNAVQTVTRYIVTPTSDNSWGSIDNQVNRQTAMTLSELARDLNVISLFGFCYEDKKMAGGLYYYATGSGALEIDAKEAVFSSYLVNNATKMVMAEGGEPTQILCSPAQAQLLATEHKDRLQVLRSDERRGAYVATVINEINGRGLTVMVDPDVPDTDCWLLDTSGFGLAVESVSDYDAPLDGFDGIRRKVEAEVTFEFKNPKQRCCRIKNLKNNVGFKGV
jgi:hypothetical protein